MMRWFLSAVLILSSPLWAAASGEYYRYINDSGILVIDNDLPVKYASKGYDVINKHGRVIRHVDAQVTGDALLAAKAAQKRLAKEDNLRQAQEQYDMSLLRRYSFVTDIEAEKKRKIREMEISVSILKGNLNSVRSELESEYEKAAQVERTGRAPSKSQVSRIANLEKKITTTEDMLNKRRAARDITSLEYQRSIERFKELQVMRGRRP
ncbi:MAG: hypothetical protein HRU20_02300 [Pseudomonadales bacterium]|nr:hypothetical protein [Pseudomonadales bacterium]